MYYKTIERNYIVSVGINCGGVEISEAEYNIILDLVHNKPSTSKGYDYRLKDTLEWELYELSSAPIEDEEATTEDYEAALAELGVK